MPYMDKDYVFTDHIENLRDYLETGKLLEILEIEWKKKKKKKKF